MQSWRREHHRAAPQTKEVCDTSIISQTTPFVKTRIGKSDRGSNFFTYTAENKDDLFLTLSLFSTIIVLDEMK